MALRLLHWSYGTNPGTARTEAVAATELKPLDVVLVEAGEMIPADGNVVRVRKRVRADVRRTADLL